MISTSQISAMLDYDKDCFKRICKGMKINKSCLYTGSSAHGDRLTGLFRVTKALMMVNDH